MKFMGRSMWNNLFTGNGDTTKVNIELSFDDLKNLELLVSMGFKGGFEMGLNNLDDYLSKQLEKS